MKPLTAQEITIHLTQAFQPTSLEVIDDAKLHAGHANAGAGHFRVMINSTMFEGKNRIQIHRMIYTVLEPFMNKGIHALSIDAKSS